MIDDLRRLLGEATPGKWYVRHLPRGVGGCREIAAKPHASGRQYQGSPIAHTMGLSNDARDAANAALVAAAITSLPSLLARLEAAEAVVEAARGFKESTLGLGGAPYLALFDAVRKETR